MSNGDFTTSWPTEATAGTPWYTGRGFDLGGVDLSGGGGGWNLTDVAKAAWPWVQIGTSGIGTWLAIDRASQMSGYNRAIQDYYRQQQDLARQYNERLQEFFTQRRAFEEGVAEQFASAREDLGGSLDQFNAALSTARETLQANLAQSQALIKPAVAALAKGEVPPEFAPILNQAKQRARAAGLQSLANAGVDNSTARAALEAQIDQEAQQMLVQTASAMLSQGGALVGTAATAEQASVDLARAGLDPVLREFLMAQQALIALLGGGLPTPAVSAPPPAPVA